jgi:very-short-patch-repair endonuclease
MSNGYFFEYFVGFEVAALIGYKNPKDVITKNVSKSNQLVFRDFPGVKEPALDPRTILITRDGAIEILIKTRKRISPDILHILKKFNIETTNRKCLTKEQQTLTSIANTFKTEKFEDQYKIGKYYLDLYFPDYKIVVECDENGHADRKPERERMDFVNKKLNIDDNNWIRFNPDEYDFDMSKVIGRVYRKIKEKSNKNVDDIDYKKLEEKIKILEEEKYNIIKEGVIKDRKDIKRSKIIKPMNFDIKYNCEICDSSFKLENNLKIHLKKVHDIGDEIKQRTFTILINDKKQDIVINEDNMINATLICKETTKHFYNYNSRVNTRSEIKKISEKFKIPEEKITSSKNNLAHVYLFKHFSNWLSKSIGEQVEEIFDILKILENTETYQEDKILKINLEDGKNIDIIIKKNNYIGINNLCKESGKTFAYWKRTKNNLNLLKKYDIPILEYDDGVFVQPEIAMSVAKWCNKDYEKYFKDFFEDYDNKSSDEETELEKENVQEDKTNNEEYTIDVEQNNINIEEDNNTKTCKICSKVFVSQSKLKRHFESVHKKITYKCEKCNKNLSSKESLKTHIENVHDKKRLINCELCNNQFSNNTSLQLHIKAVHKKSLEEKCEICNKTFSTHKSLSLHIKKVHEGDKINCNLCNKIIDKDSINYHTYLIHNIK